MAEYIPSPALSPIRQPSDRRPNQHNRDPSSQQRRATNRSRSTDPRHRPSTWQYSCGLCQADHAIRTCPSFRRLTAYQRYETVERRGYCRNCLARSHLAPDCPALTACRECDSRHHTMLHGAPQLEDQLGRVAPTESVFRRASVFVPTATIRIVVQEEFKVVRALLCQATTISRIAATTVGRLGLATRQRQGHTLTRITIKPYHDRPSTIIRTTALVTSELPRLPYSNSILEDPTTEFRRATLADVDPRGNDPVEVEIGGDAYAYLRRREVRATCLGAVSAFQTSLGYVFAGPVINALSNNE